MLKKTRNRNNSQAFTKIDFCVTTLGLCFFFQIDSVGRYVNMLTDIQLLNETMRNISDRRLFSLDSVLPESLL